MTEYELLDYLVETRKGQGEALGLLVTLNFAMFSASYYFLNTTTNGLKILSFVLYTLGFIVFGGLFYLHTKTLVAARIQLSESGADGLLAKAWIAQQDALAVQIIDAAWMGGSVFLWLGAAYLLFIWRCPPR